MRFARLGFSWLVVMTSGAAGTARAEFPPVPPTVETRPVVLVEHEIHAASPFSTDAASRGETAPRSGAVTRLPPLPIKVPASAPPAGPALNAATAPDSPHASSTESPPASRTTNKDERWSPETRFEPAIRAPRSANSSNADSLAEGSLGPSTSTRGAASLESPTASSTSLPSVTNDGWRSLVESAPLAPVSTGSTTFAPSVAPPPCYGAVVQTRSTYPVNSPAPMLVPSSSPSMTPAPADWQYVALPIRASSETALMPTYVIPTSGPWPPQAMPSHPYAIGGVNPQVPPPKVESRYLARNVWGESKEFVTGQPVRNAWRYVAP